MIAKFDKALYRLESTVMVAMMAVAILLTVVQVAMRYVFNAPLYWAEEVVLFAIIAMSFMGVSFGVTQASHISVDVLRAFLPRRFVKPLTLISLGLGVVFGLVLVRLGAQLTLTTFGRGQLSSGLRIPMAAIYAVIPFAGCATVFRYALEFGKAWRKADDADDPHTPRLL